MDIDQLLHKAVELDASDTHLSSGLPPKGRVDGDIVNLGEQVLDPDELSKTLLGMLTDPQKATFKEQYELDFSYEIKGLARFRVNYFYQNRGISAVFRTIPSKVLTLEDISAPPLLGNLCELPRGLVVVTGPTGSGKSTTLAAMLNHINQNFSKHMLTLEDPIEFVHESSASIVQQREVGQHTLSFANALRVALREDPDVILVGEMRDLETIRLALTAAETGHLVFSTLHTSSAAKTINRIIDVFPAGEKALVRSMLSESLQAVVAQVLIKQKGGGGRVAAQELMTCTPAIRNMIREDKIPQIYSAIQTGRQYGMQTLEQALTELVDQDLIEQEQADTLLMDQKS